MKHPPIILAITPEPSRPGEPPAEIRLRQWLKLGLRAFRLRAAWHPTARQKRRWKAAKP